MPARLPHWPGCHAVDLGSGSRPVHLDLSALEATIATGPTIDVIATLLNVGPKRGAKPYGAPASFYLCQDGMLRISAMEDHQWRGVVAAMGSPSWAKSAFASDSTHASKARRRSTGASLTGLEHSRRHMRRQCCSRMVCLRRGTYSPARDSRVASTGPPRIPGRRRRGRQQARSSCRQPVPNSREQSQETGRLRPRC